ncbi:MAG: hypothetical protein V3T72_17170 [Thermoanaerobaculia bacterium]
MPEHPISEHRFELPATDPRTALRLVGEAADAWGASWKTRGDRGLWLRLPVMAGVRHGWVAGEVEVEAADGGSQLVYRVDESEYRLDKATVFTLVLAAFGALVSVVGPFFPGLVRLMPIGIMLTVAAWLFIVGRLRNSGPEEFFEDVVDELAGEADAGG